MAVHVLDWDAAPPPDCRGGALTLGNFDGVHRGHAALLAELRRQAQDVGGPAVVVTFDPHPLQLLRPEQFLPVLTTPADRAALLQAQGADQVLILRTSRELLRLSAADFFTHVLRDRLGARALVEGANFGFGRNREGNIETLAALCRRDSLTLTVVPPFLWQGERVSSSRVRAALLRGAVREAADLLARPYALHGTVGTGQRRGQTLGFPTANLEQIATLIPGDGVYAVQARLPESDWPAAANLGTNPTFGEQARKVEVHLIDFHGDLYGRELTVEFVERLRDTRRFEGGEQLVAQLRLDVEQARLHVAAAALRDRVVRVLAEEVGPALELDGAAIEVLDVTDGVARLRLGGVCAGCPSTLMTLVMGIEQELRKHVPEVEYLEAVP